MSVTKFNMLRFDAHKSDSFHNIHYVNLDVVAAVEKEITSYDLISLVFLLYKSPDVAFERLTVFQKVYKDLGEKNLNLLHDWAQQVQSTSTWRHEFLEALAICQIYNVIKKMGFEVAIVQNHFQPNNIQVNHYVNPMKKALYKLCENLTTDNFEILKNTLKTYEFDTAEFKMCELLFLHLMCKKFIVTDDEGNKYQIEKLANVIDTFTLPDIKQFANDLRKIEKKFNGDHTPTTIDYTHAKHNPSTSEIFKEMMKEKYQEPIKQKADDILTPNAFVALCNEIAGINLEDRTSKNIKSDTQMQRDAYLIKNHMKIGVCHIINQEDFHPSRSSIENKTLSSLNVLEKRLGSTKDKKVLKDTMESLKFEVITHCNLDHNKMKDVIKSIIKYRVQPDDSVYVLCILSHGVKGHIYAADSVMVKVQDIQNMLNKGFEERKLQDIPKVLILQACQVNHDEPKLFLVPDSPSSFHIKKAHFCIYWATAPELEAFRDEDQGSIFIQVLCYLLVKLAKSEHLNDIFTIVTDCVAHICTKLQKDQVPIFESTFRKKLYLQIPKV